MSVCVCVKTHRPVTVAEPLPAPAKAGVCTDRPQRVRTELKTEEIAMLVPAYRSQSVDHLAAAKGSQPWHVLQNSD